MIAGTRFVLLLLFAMATAAPEAFAYTKVPIRYFIPPSSPLPRSVETLAILDFSGPDGDKFADSVIRGLIRERDYSFYGRTLPETRFFEVIERSRINTILREQNLSSTGLIDEASAAEFGKVAGVDAVFLGEISHEPVTSRTTEKRISDGREYAIQCVTHKSRSEFNGRIIDVDSGTVLSVFALGTNSGESKACGQGKNPQPHSEQIDMNCVGLMASVVVELLGSINIHERELEKIKVKDFSDRAKKAAKLAESGSMSEAYVLYKSIYDEDPYSAQNAYNLGVMHEAVGNYEQAEQLYASAVNLNPKEDDFTEAHDDVVRTLTALVKAQEVLQFEYPEYDFNVDEASLARATSATVVTDGGRDERHQVFDGPDGTGTVRIPGSLELILLEDKGDWLRIGLPDGKEGWMQSDSIDKGSLRDARES